MKVDGCLSWRGAPFGCWLPSKVRGGCQGMVGIGGVGVQGGGSIV